MRDQTDFCLIQMFLPGQEKKSIQIKIRELEEARVIADKDSNELIVGCQATRTSLRYARRPVVLWLSLHDVVLCSPGVQPVDGDFIPPTAYF